MQKDHLLFLIEEGFHRKAWHGPNLQGALCGVTVDQALWRPAKHRHNIWEMVVHAAYWKYVVARRLTKSRKHRFPENGRDWFVRNGSRMTKKEAVERWKNDLALLKEAHQELRFALIKLAESDLTLSTQAGQQTVIRNIAGVAMHDVYHAGQIKLLRKLYLETRSPRGKAR